MASCALRPCSHRISLLTGTRLVPLQAVRNCYYSPYSISKWQWEFSWHAERRKHPASVHGVHVQAC
eukprot:480094-Pelagomonas_calceolata.AAC.1